MADTLTRVVRTIVLVKQDRAFHVDRRGTRWKMTELTWNLPGWRGAGLLMCRGAFQSESSNSLH